MKKVLAITLTFLMLLPVTSHLTLAAPPESEVNQILNELGWTRQELEDYLSFYEMNLDDFETTEDLQAMLGTPITDENLNDLLKDYSLTREQLNSLLAGFGESLDDYKFIEDLDNAVDFYVNHDEELEESEALLSQIGLTEEEVDRFFNYLISLDETTLETEMENIEKNLAPFMEMEDLTQLTPEQEQALADIWKDMLNAFHLKATFYLASKNGTKTAVSFQDLMKLETLNGKQLLVELSDLQGNLLLDMQLSEEMLSSDFLLDSGSELADVGDLAGELTDQLHAGKLPNTASPYGRNIMVGFILILLGSLFYVRFKNPEKV
ncbi:processed acidic surface protein [Ectobacillus funiculus]|uniref:processed acidic surface protein n=1 Tax=Ectobacillus funiculus TaxID=137993 RepID=UPI00397A892B